MNINIICYSQSIRNNQIRRAVGALNYVQNYFHFCYVETEKDVCETRLVNWQKFCDGYISNNQYNIFITEKAFDDNWFSHEEHQYAIISTAGWENNFAPPSLRAYIVYQVAQSIMNFEADINERMEENMIHYKAKGCIFDFCEHKNDIKIGMNAGIICPSCRNSLRGYGVEESALDAIEKMLGYVRSEAIAQPMNFDENTAFIVMKFTKNDENQNAYLYGIKPALEELGIRCIRADDDVNFGPILANVIEHIKRSKFIIVKVDTQSLNVYFELGFAMGLQKDILLVSDRGEVGNLPIDLSNMECLTYSRGNYLELKERIKEFYKSNYHYNVLREEAYN